MPWQGSSGKPWLTQVPSDNCFDGFTCAISLNGGQMDACHRCSSDEQGQSHGTVKNAVTCTVEVKPNQRAPRHHRDQETKHLHCMRRPENTRSDCAVNGQEALTRQQSALEGGVNRVLLPLLSVPAGHVHGWRPVAPTFLSEQVGRQHLQTQANPVVNHSIGLCHAVYAAHLPLKALLHVETSDDRRWCALCDSDCTPMFGYHTLRYMLLLVPK
jgi:hypothetical protein